MKLIDSLTMKLMLWLGLGGERELIVKHEELKKALIVAKRKMAKLRKERDDAEAERDYWHHEYAIARKPKRKAK